MIGAVRLIPELLSKPLRDGADSESEALAALLGPLDIRPVDEALAELATSLGSAHELRAADVHPDELPEERRQIRRSRAVRLR